MGIKYIVISTALLIFLTILSCSNSNKMDSSTITSEEKKIAQNLIQGAFDDLWGGLDSTKILQYHTQDFYILEQGKVWDNNRIKEFMKAQLAREVQLRRVNKMKYLTVEKIGSIINIAYENRAEFYKADSLVGKAEWLESALAIPTTDGWRLRCMHSTFVPEVK